MKIIRAAAVLILIKTSLNPRRMAPGSKNSGFFILIMSHRSGSNFARKISLLPRKIIFNGSMSILQT